MLFNIISVSEEAAYQQEQDSSKRFNQLKHPFPDSSHLFGGVYYTDYIPAPGK